MRNFLALLCVLAPLPATAQPPESIASLAVLPGWQTPDGTRMAAFAITLAPGWKTYWRSPGDAGIPPLFDLSASVNVAGAAFHWPVPDVFDQGGMRSIGFHDQLVLPVELTATQPGAPMVLSGEIDMGVCEDICVPVRLLFDAAIPAEGQRDARIVAALVNRPLTATEAGLVSAVCAVAPAPDGLTVSAELILPSAGGPEAVVVEADDPQIWVSEPDVSRNGERLTVTADLVNSTGAAFVLDRSALRFTVLGQKHAVDIRGCTGG